MSKRLKYTLSALFFICLFATSCTEEMIEPDYEMIYLIEGGTDNVPDKSESNTASEIDKSSLNNDDAEDKDSSNNASELHSK